MKKIRVALMLLVACAVAVPSFAASDVTVGQFLVEIAKVKNLAANDGRTAANSLKAAGVALPEIDLTKSLSEGDVAVIARAAGVNLTTSNPSASFSRSQVDNFIKSFGTELGRNPGDGPVQPNAPSFDPETKGQKKGHKKTRNEIP